MFINFIYSLDNQFVYSVITAIFIGGAAGYIGTLMVSKRMALVGDALGHIALPGVALAILYDFNIIGGAFVSLFLGILLIWFFRTKTKIHMEALTGIVFTVSLALAFLILPNGQIEEALVGNITSVSLFDMAITAMLVIVVLIVINRIFPKIILGSLSEDLAEGSKINVKKYDFIYLLMVGIIVGLGIKVVGSLLIGALVIIPAAASRNLSKNLFQYSYGGMVVGVLSCIVGIMVFRLVGFGAGPFIILTSASIFLVSLLFSSE